MPKVTKTANAEWIDHRAEVLKQLNENKSRVLYAMGIKSVGLINQQMKGGYGRPIQETGDLMRDVNFQVERSKPDTVDVGNSLEYASFVHEGTRKMQARPYIRDAIHGGIDQIQAVAEQEMKKGF